MIVTTCSLVLQLRREVGNLPPTWASLLERVTGIEPALSAWEIATKVQACRQPDGRNAPLGAPTDRWWPWQIARR